LPDDISKVGGFPVQSAILPFWPVIKDFIINIWHLRLFLLLIFATLILSTGILVATEGKFLVPEGMIGNQICSAILFTLNDVLPGSVVAYSPTTLAGKVVRIFNSLIGFVLLGLLLWVIQKSLSDHRLKKAKYLFIPTKKDC
jgi:hypothetical protein